MVSFLSRSSDQIVEGLLHMYDSTRTKYTHSDEQWDSYSNFSWRLGIYLISQLNMEEKDKFWRGFTDIEENKDILRYICNNSKISNEIESVFNEIMRRTEKTPPKSETKAITAMKQAITSIQNSDYIEALEKFSEAIGNFPLSSQKLGECLNHRGACLYKLKMYEDACKDFSEAINILKSKKERINSLFMKSLCYTNLDRCEEADELWKEAELELRNEFLDDNYRHNIVEHFKSQRNSNITKPYDEEVKIPIYDDHYIYGAPKYLNLCISETKGRTLKTSVDIPKGTIVMSEDPAVSWLAPCKYENYCNNCFKEIGKRYLPCRNCTLVRYCSLACESTAWKKWHSVECPHLDLLKYCSFNHLALRVVIIFGFDNVLKTIEESKNSTKKSDRTFPYSYKSFYSFIGDRSHLNKEQQFAFCVGCLIVIKIAEHMNLIQRNSPHYFTFASIVLKHILQTNINCFAVIDTDIRHLRDLNIYVDAGNSMKIGIAIYFGTSMVSHSCDYNCSKYTFGNQLIYIANRDIKVGEEITITYCPHYKKMSFKDRQMYLKTHYHFDCNCNACMNRWENLHFAYRCPQCSGALVWNSDFSSYCIDCGLKNADTFEIASSAQLATEDVNIARQFLDRNETRNVEQKLNQSLETIRNAYYSVVQEEPIIIQLCRYYEIRKEYDKAFQCCLKMFLIAQAKNDDTCLEAISFLIKGIDFLVEEIEYLSYCGRPISVKLFKARELFSSCLNMLHFNQCQQLPLVSKLFAGNFRLIPKINHKLNIKSQYF